MNPWQERFIYDMRGRPCSTGCGARITDRNSGFCSECQKLWDVSEEKKRVDESFRVMHEDGAFDGTVAICDFLRRVRSERERKAVLEVLT